MRLEQNQFQQSNSLAARANRWKRVQQTTEELQEVATAFQALLSKPDSIELNELLEFHAAALTSDINDYYGKELASLQDIATEEPTALNKLAVTQMQQRITGTKRAISLLTDPAKRDELAQLLSPRVESYQHYTAHYLSEKNFELAYEAEATGTSSVNPPDAVYATVFAKEATKHKKSSASANLPRYKKLDELYQLGNSEVVEGNSIEDRVFHKAIMPRMVRQSKWRLTIATMDALFDINLADKNPEQIDSANLERLAELYTHLSEHERGATNDAMPGGKKFIHNAASHSLGVAALTDKIFWNSYRQLRDMPASVLRQRGLTESERNDAINTLWEQRQQAMLAALLHDGGENKGELSNGEKKQNKSDAELEQHEFERGVIERNRFLNFVAKCDSRIVDGLKLLGLNRAATAVKNYLNFAPWHERSEQWNLAFNVPEQTHTFLGRLVKAIERTHSQHDYLRLNMDTNFTKLRSLSDSSKQFTAGYLRETVMDYKPAEIARNSKQHQVGDASTANDIFELDWESHAGKQALLVLKDQQLLGHYDTEETFIVSGEKPLSSINKLINNLLYENASYEFEKTNNLQRQAYLGAAPASANRRYFATRAAALRDSGDAISVV